MICTRRGFLRIAAYGAATGLTGCAGDYRPRHRDEATTVTETIKSGSYELFVTLTHKGSQVTNFAVKFLKYPEAGAESTVKQLLLGSGLLDPAEESEAIVYMLGGQPLLKRIKLRLSGLLYRIWGDLLYKVNDEVVQGVSENIDAPRSFGPADSIELTLKSGTEGRLV